MFFWVRSSLEEDVFIVEVVVVVLVTGNDS